MHQDKDDEQRLDQAPVVDDTELSDAELGDTAGGVIINHEEQMPNPYSLIAEDADIPEIPDPLNPSGAKTGDPVKGQGEPGGLP